LAMDLLRGETVMGEEMEATPKGIAKEVWERTVSMFIDDVIEAYQDAGIIGAGLVAPAAFFGMGAQTYEPPPPSSELASWVAALKRDEDKVQRLIRQGKMSEAMEVAANNPLLDIQPEKDDYYSMSRRRLAGNLAKINITRAAYNKAEETKASLLGMTEEQKEDYLKLLEERMNEEAQAYLNQFYDDYGMMR